MERRQDGGRLEPELVRRQPAAGGDAGAVIGSWLRRVDAIHEQSLVASSARLESPVGRYGVGDGTLLPFPTSRGGGGNVNYLYEELFRPS